MTEYKKYPEYKDSGVEWIGEIPSDWRVQALKKNTSIISKKKNIPNFTLAMENIQSWTGNLLGSFSKEYETSGIHFLENDILFGKLRPYLAKVWQADREGSAVGDFYVIRGNKNYLSHYLRYLLVSADFIDLINSSTYGAKMPRVGWSFMGNSQVPLPPSKIQQQIAIFLDAETKKIDDSVSSMESLISLLTEKRSALISETVTRGIPGEHTEFKDSGVEWLGNIPTEWDIKLFRRCFRELNELNGDYPVGKMVSVSGYRGVEYKTYASEDMRRAENEIATYRVIRPGQLAVNTMWLNYGGLGVSSIEGHMSPAYRAYNIDSELDKQYIHHLLRSSIYIKGYTGLLKGIRPNSLQMSRKDLMVFPIVVPSKQEQARIASYLEKEIPKIDRIINEVKNSIILLKEKRQTLISDVVTGKIDVRDIVD